jgi:hypothetical protein
LKNFAPFCVERLKKSQIVSEILAFKQKTRHFFEKQVFFFLIVILFVIEIFSIYLRSFAGNRLFFQRKNCKEEETKMKRFSQGIFRVIFNPSRIDLDTDVAFVENLF